MCKPNVYATIIQVFEVIASIYFLLCVILYAQLLGAIATITTIVQTYTVRAAPQTLPCTPLNTCIHTCRSREPGIHQSQQSTPVRFAPAAGPRT